MHTHPNRSWNRACRAVADSADQIDDLIQKDIPLRPDSVTGGREGVRYDFGALHPCYRRVQWNDRPVERELPIINAFTQSVILGPKDRKLLRFQPEILLK